MDNVKLLKTRLLSATEALNNYYEEILPIHEEVELMSTVEELVDISETVYRYREIVSKLLEGNMKLYTKLGTEQDIFMYLDDMIHFMLSVFGYDYDLVADHIALVHNMMDYLSDSKYKTKYNNSDNITEEPVGDTEHNFIPIDDYIINKFGKESLDKILDEAGHTPFKIPKDMSDPESDIFSIGDFLSKNNNKNNSNDIPDAFIIPIGKIPFEYNPEGLKNMFSEIEIDGDKLIKLLIEIGLVDPDNL